jgi:membrane-bound ClpP family serine protease
MGSLAFMTLLFTVGVLLITVMSWLVYESRHRKRLPFPKSFISSPAIVDTPLTPHGSILINGELWLARSANDQELASRTKVIVVGTRDHLLMVAEL